MCKKILYLLCILAVSATVAAAQTTTWTGTVSTDWDNPANWSDGVPDSSTQTIYIPADAVNDLVAPGLYEYTANVEMTGRNLNGSTRGYPTKIQSVFNLKGGGWSGYDVYIGRDVGKTGTMNVSGDAALYIERYMYLGVSGATGTLNIFGTSNVDIYSLSVGIAALFGNESGSTGYVNIRANAKIDNLQIGIISNNEFSPDLVATGTVKLYPGVTVDNRNLVVGNGMLSMEDATLNVGYSASVGQNGQGRLEILSGNIISAAPTPEDLQHGYGFNMRVGHLYYPPPIVPDNPTEDEDARGGAQPPVLYASDDPSNTPAVHGTVDQMGGTVDIRNLSFSEIAFNDYFGEVPGQTVLGVYNQSGGQMTARYVVSGMVSNPYDDRNADYRGRFTTPVTMRTQWDISGDADVHILAETDVLMEKEQGLAGAVCLSYGKIVNDPAANTFPGGVTYESEVNITGGTIRIDRNLAGFGDDTINVWGAKASIEVGAFNQDVTVDTVTSQSTLQSNFYLGSEGVSAINVNGAADLGNAHEIGLYQGFVSLKEDRYDLIVADSFSDDTWAVGTNITDNTGMGWSAGNTEPALDGSGRKAAYIYLEQDTIDAMDAWLWNDEALHELGTSAEEGVVRVDGFEGKEIYAHLEGLDGSAPGSNVAQSLVDYLNEVNNGAHFTLVGDSDMLITGSVLNGDGDAYFAWDFGDFNLAQGFGPGSGVGIIAFSINVPEPATWVMLLLGCGAVIFFRRRKKA